MLESSENSSQFGVAELQADDKVSTKGCALQSSRTESLSLERPVQPVPVNGWYGCWFSAYGFNGDGTLSCASTSHTAVETITWQYSCCHLDCL